MYYYSDEETKLLHTLCLVLHNTFFSEFLAFFLSDGRLKMKDLYCPFLFWIVLGKGAMRKVTPLQDDSCMTILFLVKFKGVTGQNAPPGDNSRHTTCKTPQKVVATFMPLVLHHAIIWMVTIFYVKLPRGAPKLNISRSPQHHFFKPLGPIYPVDKNRSIIGGQSGPSYLQQWPQQEDSPDHAYWVKIFWRGNPFYLSTY